MLICQVYLRPWGASEDQSPSLQHRPSQPHDIRLQSDAFPSATLLERWMFHFEPAVQDGNLQRRHAQLARLDPPAVYKRAVSDINCMMFVIAVAADVEAVIWCSCDLGNDCR